MPKQKRQQLKQRKDGRYCCLYQGKQFMGNTSDEALDKRDAYIKQLESQQYIENNYTVSQYATKWLPLHKDSVSVKCYNDYAKQLEALTAVIGKKRLTEITVDDAAAVWKHYSGYSASTIHRAKMLFVSLFDAAIENELCRKNPFRAKYAQPPKAPSGSHRALTDEEITLIQTVTHRMHAAAMIMLYAGLRRGEVLALTPDDIDLEHGMITVNKAVRFDGNRPVIVRPKTSAGIRDVPILSVLRPTLETLHERPASMINGDIMTDTSFRRAWDSYMLHLTQAAGHPIDIQPHDLRHTYCTMLRDAGIDMKQAMIWMGHADEKMILHVYDHITDKRTRNSINQMENMLQNMQNHMQT